MFDQTEWERIDECMKKIDFGTYLKSTKKLWGQKLELSKKSRNGSEKGETQLDSVHK